MEGGFLAETRSAKAVLRVPLEPGFFTIPEDPAESPRLLGSRCQSCGECFFPRRPVCAKCCQRGTDDVELSPNGTLYTWTYLHVPLFNSLRAAESGYAVGQIDLPEGPRIQAVLEGEQDSFEIGMEMEMGFEVLRRNEEGQEVVTFRYCPRNRKAGQGGGVQS